jgi:hypothetical protein
LLDRVGNLSLGWRVSCSFGGIRFLNLGFIAANGIQQLVDQAG